MSARAAHLRNLDRKLNAWLFAQIALSVQYAAYACVVCARWHCYLLILLLSRNSMRHDAFLAFVLLFILAGHENSFSCYLAYYKTFVKICAVALNFCLRERTSLRISFMTDLAFNFDFNFMSHKLCNAFTIIRFWHRPHIHSQWSSHESDKHLYESIIEWRSGLTPRTTQFLACIQNHSTSMHTFHY